jgi:hypothetical protein
MDSNKESKSDILSVLDKFREAVSQDPPSINAARELVLESSYGVLAYPSGRITQYTLSDAIVAIEARTQSHGGRQEEKLPGLPTLEYSDPPREVWIHEDIAAVWGGYQLVATAAPTPLGGVGVVSLARAPATGWRISGFAALQQEEEEEHGPEHAGGPLLPGTTQAAPSPDLMQPIDALLGAFSAPDWPALAPWFLAGGGCTLTRPPASPRAVSFAESIARLQGIIAGLPAGMAVEERIHDVEARVCYDGGGGGLPGGLGFVWAPFHVDFGGRPMHSGVNIFTFVRREGRWVFCGCQDYGKTIEPS